MCRKASARRCRCCAPTRRCSPPSSNRGATAATTGTRCRRAISTCATCRCRCAHRRNNRDAPADARCIGGTWSTYRRRNAYWHLDYHAKVHAPFDALWLTSLVLDPRVRIGGRERQRLAGVHGAVDSDAQRVGPGSRRAGAGVVIGNAQLVAVAAQRWSAENTGGRSGIPGEPRIRVAEGHERSRSGISRQLPRDDLCVGTLADLVVFAVLVHVDAPWRRGLVQGDVQVVRHGCFLGWCFRLPSIVCDGRWHVSQAVFGLIQGLVVEVSSGAVSDPCAGVLLVSCSAGSTGTDGSGLFLGLLMVYSR